MGFQQIEFKGCHVLLSLIVRLTLHIFSDWGKFVNGRCFACIYLLLPKVPKVANLQKKWSNFMASQKATDFKNNNGF